MKNKQEIPNRAQTETQKTNNQERSRKVISKRSRETRNMALTQVHLVAWQTDKDNGKHVKLHTQGREEGKKGTGGTHPVHIGRKSVKADSLKTFRMLEKRNL